MPHNCVVQGCNNRSSKKECENISFHALPLSDMDILREWIIKARLPQKLINRHSRVCSAHFLGGKRSEKYDVPQIFPWTKSRKQPPSRIFPTFSHFPESSSCSPSLPSTPCSHSFAPPRLLPSSPTPTSCPLSTSLSNSPAAILECASMDTVKHDHSYCKPWPQQEKLTVIGESETIDDIPHSTESMDTATRHTHFHASSSVQCSLLQQSFGVSQFCRDDAGIHFYTGLPDYRTFIASFKFLGDAVNHLNYWYGGKTKVAAPPNNKGAPRILTPLNEYFLVLCRLRLGLLEQDLVYRFHLSQTTSYISDMCDLDKFSICQTEGSPHLANKSTC